MVPLAGTQLSTAHHQMGSKGAEGSQAGDPGNFLEEVTTELGPEGFRTQPGQCCWRREQEREEAGKRGSQRLRVSRQTAATERR